MTANARSGGEKRRKPSEEDRISNLPKPVLYHILSLLPTIDAVATSLLSRSWKCHWKNIHNLYFSDIVDRPRRRKVKYKKFKFAHFVNRVLILLNQQTLDKAVFKIKECCMEYDLTTWVTGVVARKPKVLEISLTYTDYYPQNRLPSCIFTCNMLEVLVLSGIENLEIPSVVSLPNLKSLRLGKVRCQSNESFQTLISGCSSLETLDIDGDGVISTISSLTLRNLTYSSGHFLGDLRSKLEINAPGLKYLKLSKWVPRGFSFDNLCSLDEAIIETDYVGDGEKDRSVLGYFEGVSKVNDLKLCHNTIKVLDHAGASLWLLSLTRLTVEAECCSLNWLLKLVEQSNQLEFLELRLVGMHHTSYPIKISTCSSISLRTLVIDNFRGQEDELAVVAFFLKKAEFLTTMMIKPDRPLDDANRFQLLQKVSEFPRISTSCHITFS